MPWFSTHSVYYSVQDHENGAAVNVTQKYAYYHNVLLSERESCCVLQKPRAKITL